jgi:hypothetical protein
MKAIVINDKMLVEDTSRRCIYSAILVDVFSVVYMEFYILGEKLWGR